MAHDFFEKPAGLSGYKIRDLRSLPGRERGKKVLSFPLCEVICIFASHDGCTPMHPLNELVGLLVGLLE